MSKGVVKWYEENNLNYGWICLDHSTKEIFFHRSNILRTIKLSWVPTSGEEVTFVVREGDRGILADNVRPVPAKYGS